MQLIDRKKLRKLIAAQEVTQRELARAAGWKTHSYLGRLLRGEVTTLEVEPAARIAKYLGVPMDDLFMTRMSDNVRRGVGPHGTRAA